MSEFNIEVRTFQGNGERPRKTLYTVRIIDRFHDVTEAFTKIQCH